MPLSFISEIIKKHIEHFKMKDDIEKEKIGCPITLGEYEEIVKNEKGEENKE